MQNIETVLKKILILLTTTLLLAACSTDSDPAVNNDGRRVPLQVTGYIADTPHGITRAHGTYWDAGDQIGLYAVNSDTTEPIEDGSNVCYSTASGGETAGSTFLLFTTSTPIILPATGDIEVYGYYPYSSGVTTPAAVAVNVSTQDPQKNIDLMATGKVSTSTYRGTTPINSTNSKCELLFQHRLTKLVFNLDLTEMVSVSTTSLTIGSQRTAATYSIYTDVLTCSGDANQTITAVRTTNEALSKSYEAIVLPNDESTNPAVDRTVTIVVDGRSYTFTIAKSGVSSGNKVVTSSFETGKKYIYNVKVYPFTIEVNTEKYTEQW